MKFIVECSKIYSQYRYTKGYVNSVQKTDPMSRPSEHHKDFQHSFSTFKTNIEELKDPQCTLYFSSAPVETYFVWAIYYAKSILFVVSQSYTG